jgi:hypothetical protein
LFFIQFLTFSNFYFILRLREGNKKGNGFLSNLGIGLKQADKDDKSLLESAAKQLKILIAQNSLN